MDQHEFTLEMLEQIASSDEQAELFADYIEQHTLISAPHTLTSSILERSRQLDVQTAVAVNQTGKRLQLFYYSLKVGSAVAAALVLLISMPLFPDQIQLHTRSSSRILWEKAEEINDRFTSFSDKLLNLEVSFYD